MGGVLHTTGLKPVGRPTSGAAPPLLSTLWLADLCIGTAAPGLKLAAGWCRAAAGRALGVELVGVELVGPSCGASCGAVAHWPAGPVAEGVLGCWCAACGVAGGAGIAGEGGLIHCSRCALFCATAATGVAGCQGACCGTAGGPATPGGGGGGIAAYGCAAEGGCASGAALCCCAAAADGCEAAGRALNGLEEPADSLRDCSRTQPWSVPYPRRVLYDGRLPWELSMLALVVEALSATARSPRVPVCILVYFSLS